MNIWFEEKLLIGFITFIWTSAHLQKWLFCGIAPKNPQYGDILKAPFLTLKAALGGGFAFIW